MYTPKVSIIIPAYNASKYISEAIDSALAQTYQNFEIIVVNDGSNDDGATERIALSYGNRIRYFSKENGGSSSALNTGIANMTGEWFSWLSHDDLYLPERLEKQIEHINSLTVNKSELAKHIFFSSCELINAEGKTIRTDNKKKSLKLAQAIEAFQHNGHLIAEPTLYNFHGCSCLIHKNAFTDVGLFDEHLRLVNDVDLWFRLYTANYKVHYIPDVLIKGRIHPQQISKSIGYSYHNPEQDMYWKRSLDWLLTNYPNEEKLFFLFGRNAYLKSRKIDGDRAFDQITSVHVKKHLLKLLYKCIAFTRCFLKTLYIKIKT